MTSTFIVVLPLLPGKQEAWRQLSQTLQGSRRHEYADSLRRMGITKQEVWLAQSLHQDLREQMLTALAASAHPFDRWIRKQLLELHGLDVKRLATSASELISVWPPARVETTVTDQQKRHEYKE